MRIDRRTEWPHWVLILGMFAWAAVSWSTAPDRFPVHWNVAGEVDRYGGKIEGLLVLPVMTLVIYLLLIFLPLVDPGRANYPRFAGAYATIRLSVTVLLTAVYGLSQLAAYGSSIDVSLVISILVGGLLIVIGSILDQIRPNWFVGIRTPWTLSSQRSWTRTHRLGGRLFVLMGLAIIAAGLARLPLAFLGAGIVVIASLIWMVVYSYLVWRSDPDRVTLAGDPRR